MSNKEDLQLYISLADELFGKAYELGRKLRDAMLNQSLIIDHRTEQKKKVIVVKAIGDLEFAASLCQRLLGDKTPSLRKLRALAKKNTDFAKYAVGMVKQKRTWELEEEFPELCTMALDGFDEVKRLRQHWPADAQLLELSRHLSRAEPDVKNQTVAEVYQRPLKDASVELQKPQLKNWGVGMHETQWILFHRFLGKWQERKRFKLSAGRVTRLAKGFVKKYGRLSKSEAIDLFKSDNEGLPKSTIEDRLTDTVHSLRKRLRQVIAVASKRGIENIEDPLPNERGVWCAKISIGIVDIYKNGKTTLQPFNQIDHL